MIDVSKKLPDGKIRDQHSYVDGGIQHSYVDDGTNVYYADTGEIIDGLRAQILPDKFVVKTV